MRDHMAEHRAGFKMGWTDITCFDDPGELTGLGVAVLKLRQGEKIERTFGNECAWLLMAGAVRLEVDHDTVEVHRGSLFDEGPSCVHGPVGTRLAIKVLEDAEFTIYQCGNTRSFPVEIYVDSDTKDELRGRGQVGGTCERIVRTIFCDDNSHPHADLVLGEVITLPGKWSSYPPHNHPQPEIYHYRFNDPRGWGHAELAEEVLKIRSNDSVRIVDMKTHAQVSAPGYAMYYAWIIRHLPEVRYTIPNFELEHSWIMESGSTAWAPVIRCGGAMSE